MATDFSEQAKAASKTADEAKERFKDTASAAAGQLADKVGAAKGTAASMVSDVGDTLADTAEKQKNAGVDAVSAFAQSARDAAGNMEENSPQVARIIRTSADAVERMGNTVRDQSVSELADSMAKFAARQPVAVFGIGLLAGLVFARLLTSTDR